MFRFPNIPIFRFSDFPMIFHWENLISKSNWTNEHIFSSAVKCSAAPG